MKRTLIIMLGLLPLDPSFARAGAPTHRPRCGSGDDSLDGVVGKNTHLGARLQVRPLIPRGNRGCLSR